MTCADAAVTCDHDPRLLIEGLNFSFYHRMHDDAGLRASSVAFPDDANESVDRCYSERIRQICQRMLLELASRRKVYDRHMTGPADFGQGLCDGFWILVLLIRDEHFDVGT